MPKLCKLYIDRIVKLHGIPASIVFDRDARFTSKFWKGLQQALGTELHLSTTFHPQTDGQSEQTIQILDDMLRACLLDFSGKWEEQLPFAEFAYNNSYQASIGMAPYEALCTVDLVDHLFVGPSMRITLLLGLITSRTPLRLPN